MVLICLPPGTLPLPWPSCRISGIPGAWYSFQSTSRQRRQPGHVLGCPEQMCSVSTPWRPPARARCQYGTCDHLARSPAPEFVVACLQCHWTATGSGVARHTRMQTSTFLFVPIYVGLCPWTRLWGRPWLPCVDNPPTTAAAGCHA